MFSSKVKKTFIIVSVSIFAFIGLVILFFSPIVKYVIEKYDQKYTGREITIEHCYANPFTGYVSLGGFKIFEHQSDTVFISAEELNLHFAVRKLLSKTYEISDITLEQPSFIVIQKKDKFNFDDLVDKFSPKDSLKDTLKDPVHFNILDINIMDGQFTFDERNTPVNYTLKKINIESTGKFWNVDSIVSKFSFTSGKEQGSFEGNIMINTDSLDFDLDVIVKKFDLQILEQYMKDLANYGAFRANLDADVKARGNFKNNQKLHATGMIAVNDFHFGKNEEEDFASFKKLVVDIDEISPAQHIHSIDSVSIDHPYFKFEQYDDLNNISAIFGKEGSNVRAVNADPEKFNLVIEIAKYIRKISKNFFRSDFKVGKFRVYEGDFRFNDYSQSEKFSVALDPFYILADSINKNKKRVQAQMRSAVKPYGYVALDLSVDPKDTSDFDLNYHFEKLSAAMLNPYIVSNTSFPLDRGAIELQGSWHVRDGSINSDNHLLVIDPRISQRVKNKDNSWLPLRVIMFFVRERGNVIDYSIPVSGKLKDPKFNLRDVIFDVLKNIFIKPVTVPYSFEVRTVENKVEKSFKVKWEFLKSELGWHEERFVREIADFLKENPDASISVFPNQFETKEKEYIWLFEAKKAYFISKSGKKQSSFLPSDSIDVTHMSAKDPGFLKFLDSHVKEKLLYTVQEKCKRFISASVVNGHYERLQKERESRFLSYFNDSNGSSRVKFQKRIDKVPFNGFPFFEIKYKKEFPADLVEAYQRMNELNSEKPRDRYSRKREHLSKAE